MDTLLPTQMFPRLPARATFVADTNFVSGTQKMFLILFRNILCPKQMFPSLRSPRNIMGNNMSSFTRALTAAFEPILSFLVDSISARSCYSAEEHKRSFCPAMCCFAVYHDVPLPHGLPSSIQQGDVFMSHVLRSFHRLFD